MGYSAIPPFAYTSILKFTIDGRPSVEDIHGLFSRLISQVPFSTHRYMFRNYANTFTTEDAIKELGILKFESSEDHDETATTFQMGRDMAKALIQQFLWTRLIENAVEPSNKTYRDKGLWRLSSKGLCILQEFCVKTKMDIGKFATYVDPSARLIFLIQIERMKENDRLNCKRKYISCLFAIMIASLPLRHNYGNENKTTFEDAHSMCSSDSGSTASASRSTSFSDYFPHIKILPNDLLVGVSYKYPQWSNQKSSFQQQKALLQNLNPSSKKFKMRAIFTSLLCCNWLIEFCTVASNDEAESIMTEFLNLGWIAFYDEKPKQSKYIESSKSIALNMTREGIKVVMDVSLKHCNDVLQQAVEDQQSIHKRCSIVSSASSSNTDSCHNHSTDEKERPSLQLHRRKSKTPLLPLLQTSTTATTYSSNSSTLSTPLYDNNTIPYFDTKQLNQASYRFYTTTTPPLSPTTPTEGASFKDGGSIKLKMVLKDAYFRSLFRDFLEANSCAETLDFWIDYDNLRRSCRRYTGMPVAAQKQLLEDAYALWEAYLKPGSTQCELNIDQTLQKDMAEEISNMVTLVHTFTPGHSKPMIVISTHSTIESLATILSWFDKVNDHISKLMASDLVPKFIRTPEYKKAVYKLLLSEDTVNKSLTQPSIVTNDLDDFPPPPQRKLKETNDF
ncbi:regulator of G protein signaling domain-containing protein [Parasitella parasitica]|nr:regulator of G protein signaling domain-containing protein [Parasitella parasitica]